jgi:D-beta-D-heptose 7-phosphate kinase/D-beta-D-heptose 1-phosphate adenosyltransferase
MNTNRLQVLLQRFPKQRILVVGDVMLDHFIWGKVSRISPEAPVPIVEVTRESYYAGGAANVVRNLRALGAHVSILSVVGEDQPGEILRDLLAQQGNETHALLTDSDRPTTVKARVIAHRQQVVRYDREKVAALSPALTGQLLAHYTRQLATVNAVVFEDYAKGLLSQSLLDTMHQQARRRGLITTADPNARHPLKYRRLTAITPNRHEAFAAAGIPYAEAADEVLRDAPLLRVGAALLKRWQPANLLITLGEHGMCLFRQGHKPHHIPTVAQEVFDVSGAGDTAIATLTAALAAKANPVEAAELANHAAGVVVGKLGTATCTPAELTASFARP